MTLVALGLVVLPGVSAVAQPVLRGGPGVALGTGFPNDVVLADLDGDGDLDQAITYLFQDGRVDVLLGDGGGGYSDPVRYPGPAEDAVLAAGDLDGDGVMDLVATSRYQSRVDVLLADGAGGLRAAQSYPLARPGASVALADVDADGRLDVVVGAWAAQTVSVLPGRGDGTLGTELISTAGGAVRTFDVGDVDRDGDLDVVVAASPENRLRLLHGTGDGRFVDPVDVLSIDYPDLVRLADLDGNGTLDLVFVRTEDVLVALGDGRGAFVQRGVYPSFGPIADLIVADTDGDERPDVLIGHYTPDDPFPGRVSVLRGTGNGVLAAALTASDDLYPRTLAAGDVEGDGDIDVVSAGTAENDAQLAFSQVVVSQGPTVLPVRFADPVAFRTHTAPIDIAVGDVDGDGNPDVLTGNADSLAVLPGVGDGGLGRPSFVRVPGPVSRVVLADVDADGDLDAIVATTATGSSGSGQVVTLRGDGQGAFAVAATLDLATSPGSRPAVADFDEDGRLDLAVVGTAPAAVRIAQGQGDGRFALLPGGLFPQPDPLALTGLVARDLDADGHADIAVLSRDRIRIAYGDGAGVLTPTVAVPAGRGDGTELLAADVTGDGRLDLVTNTAVVSGIAGGGWGPPRVGPLLSASMALGDVDQDGRADRASAAREGRNTPAALQLGLGNGAFQRALDVLAGPAPTRVALADLDGDQRLDLLTLNPNAGTVSTVLNRTEPTAADLTVNQVDPGQDLLVPGGQFMATDAVVNRGDVRTGPSMTRYFLAAGSPTILSAVPLEGVRAVPALGPGQASRGTITVTIPADLRFQEFYYLAACADGTAAVAELDELDNCLFSLVRLSPTRP